MWPATSACTAESLLPILVPVGVRFYLDSATGQPHIRNHSVEEEEVEEVLTNPGEDRPGREGNWSDGERSILESGLRP